MTKTTKPPGAGRERPILFSPEMVRAVLAGTKTQTRRVEPFEPEIHARARLLSCIDGVATYGDSIPDDPVPFTIGPRYGVPGDALWIRERWTLVASKILFAADAPDSGARWYPSIHLRRADARPVLLPIVAHERVERLQAISEEDARAEGVEPAACAPGCDCAEWSGERHRRGYAALWDKINGARGFPWSLNPWVRVVTWGPIQKGLARC